MAGSGVVRVRAWVVLSAAVVALGAIFAQGASAGAAVTGGRGPFVDAIRPMHPDATGQECFFTIPDCTSADPTVSFVIATNPASTGCVFRQDTSWGDGSADTIKQYKGGAANVPLATFTHTYATPKTFQIGYTITVPVNPHNKCAAVSGGLQFTLVAPPSLPCQSSQVTVPATTPVLPASARGAGVTYGPVSLTFTPGPTGQGTQCTMLPVTSSMPVDLIIPGAPNPIPLGQTDMTATVSLVAANDVGTRIPLCDFGSLQAVTSSRITPPLTDFAHTNGCFLTPTYHANWDQVAKWIVPSGLVQMAYSQATGSDTAIYSTQPLTYYVDLDTLPLPQGFSGDTMSALVDFIYSTLAQNLPVLDRIALIQAPSGHLLVTNPSGRRIGLDSNNRAHAFDGAGYVEVGGRSIAWILEPVFGAYHVSLRATPGSKFSLDMADLQFLGHGTAPLVENFAWNGTLGASGSAANAFSVRGTALAPALLPRESATRVKRLTWISFTVAHSVIPLGIAKALWLFGDGTRAIGRQVAHRYRKPGRYTVTLTVTDAVGYTDTVKLPVIVVKR